MPALLDLPSISTRITHSNNHRLQELYDLDSSEERSIAACDLIDLTIHSFIFSEFLREDMTVAGFFITSDRRRYDRLWLVEMEALITLMRWVGKDYPSCRIAVFNRDKNDWELWQGHGDPHAEFQRRRERILQEQWAARGPSS